jgi:hypothetical protein
MRAGAARWTEWALRLSLATAFLSAVGDRLGAWGPHEFRDWMAFLDARERDVMTLRFVEQWEYHEIAAARATPIGTVQWRIFNSKKKLAGHLMSRHSVCERSTKSTGGKEKVNAASHTIEPSRKAS